MLSLEAVRNSFIELEKVSIPENQTYSVYAYFISGDYDPRASHGNTSIAGMIISLGCYPTIEMARKRALEIITSTGHKAVFACKTGSWEYLKDEYDPDRTEMIPLNKDGDLDKAMYEQFEKERKERERKKRIQQDIDAETKEAKTGETLSAYIGEWCAVCDDANTIANMEEKIAELKIAQRDRLETVKRLQEKHPEYKKEWLKTCTERLDFRGESNMIPYLLTGFTRVLEQEGWNREDYNPATSGQ